MTELELLSIRISKLQRSLREERVTRVRPPPSEPPRRHPPRCSNCRQRGHFRPTCPEPEPEPLPPAAAPAPAPAPGRELKIELLEQVVRVTRVPARPAPRVRRALDPELETPPIRREAGSSGKRCPWCADLPHRRASTGCQGCGLPFVSDVVELNADGMRSSAGLLVEE